MPILNRPKDRRKKKRSWNHLDYPVHLHAKDPSELVDAEFLGSRKAGTDINETSISRRRDPCLAEGAAHSIKTTQSSREIGVPVFVPRPEALAWRVFPGFPD